MNRSILLVLVVSTSSFADDPFACVDPDVADVFLGGWYQSPSAYSTSVPDNFAELSVPAGFTLVGSEVADSHMSVVYKTEMNVEAAQSSAVSAMTDAGWMKMEDQRMSARGGFQTSTRPQATSFCRDDKPRVLSAISRRKSGQTYVSYSMHSQVQSQPCGEPTPTSRFDPYRTLSGHLPALKLPEDARSSNAGGGGGGDEVNSHVDVLTTMSRAALLRFFGDQIQDQQWVFDTNWSGELSSGSLWTLDTRDDGMLIGTLHIFGPSVGAVRVRFSVSPAEPKVGGQQGGWSSTTIRSN
jgi:hypothetical protein